MIAFIPARSGSKSIPNKNLKLLGEKPLIVYSIETALKAGISRVIVSTDGENIAKVAREAGAEVMMRAEELGKDDTPMIDVLKSEIPKIDPQPELVMLLQPTTPFRHAFHIRAAIDYLSDNYEFDSLISAERVPDKYNPAQTIIRTPLGLRMANGALISNRITRRQEHPECWVPTGSIYLFRTSNLEKGSIYGEKTMILETDSTININSEEDFLAAEQELNAN